jgi:hypothetical protein
VPTKVHPLAVMTPDEAVRPEHDDNVPALGVSVIVCDELVTTLPLESSTLMTGSVLNAEPDAAATGWVVKTSLVATPEASVT